MAVQKTDSSSIEYTQINAITGDSYKDRYLYSSFISYKLLLSIYACIFINTFLYS